MRTQQIHSYFVLFVLPYLQLMETSCSKWFKFVNTADFLSIFFLFILAKAKDTSSLPWATHVPILEHLLCPHQEFDYTVTMIPPNWNML